MTDTEDRQLAHRPPHPHPRNSRPDTPAKHDRAARNTIAESPTATPAPRTPHPQQPTTPPTATDPDPDPTTAADATADTRPTTAPAPAEAPTTPTEAATPTTAPASNPTPTEAATAEATPAAPPPTEAATPATTRRPTPRPGKRSPRRLLRRTFVWTHRWTSLVLGLLLLAVTTSGAVLLYQPEYFRATHGAFYRHTPSDHPIDAAEAVRVVQKAHPGFAAAWVNRESGIFEVGDAEYDAMYGVDPGTGAITGLAHRNGGTLGFLANFHECGLSCEGYPGYLAVLAKPVPTMGITFLTGVTWSAIVLGTMGLLLVWLAFTGLVTWWPGIRRLSHGFRVRWRRGRFARDFDLHRVVGAVAVPFLLMWGLTGAAFEFPVVENAWLAVTGGTAPDPHQYDFTARPAAKGAPAVPLGAASSIALARVPGEVTLVGLPTDDLPYYALSVARSYDPYAYGPYPGDATVYVDAHDSGHVKVAAGGPSPLANRLYDEVLEPAHFGWMVNGWWRVVWAAFGLSPLLLAVTGVSTYLVRRRTAAARRARLKAAAA